MQDYQVATTERLDIAYLEWNRQGARTAILLHGWPDSPECWKAVAPILADAGYRVLAPALREASTFAAPTRTDLTRLRAPAVIIGARGDFVHPLAVAREWAAAAPSAVGVTVELEDLGPAPETLGRAALSAWGR